MAVVVIMKWQGVTLAQYDEVRGMVNWEGDPPPGALFHVSASDGEALRVVDLWESPEQFQAFVDSRLMPATTKIGVGTQPDVEVFPAHATFTPGYAAKS